MHLEILVDSDLYIVCTSKIFTILRKCTRLSCLQTTSTSPLYDILYMTHCCSAHPKSLHVSSHYQLCNIEDFPWIFILAWTSNLRVTWKRCALCKHPCIKLSLSKIHPSAGQEVIAASTTLTFPTGFNRSCVSIGFLIVRLGLGLFNPSHPKVLL